ncbi:MAG: M56 family metallopeptidase [Oscillospiraceae bacterium]
MTDIFIKVVEMSLTASVVIAVIMLLRLALKKAPKVFSYILWAAALFRLLCPISFELPAAPIPKVDIPYTETVTESTYPENAVAAVPNNTEITEQVTAVPDTAGENVQPSPLQKRVDLVAVLSYVWAAFAAAMLLWGAGSWIRLSHKLKTAQKMNGNVYVSAAISDPFIMGVVRPKIYLPTGLASAENELILKHECAHIRRGDHIAKLIMYCALCIHCFNPLVWVMFKLFERDMEMSCDEKVTADMTNEQKADYSQTLLKLSVKPTASFTACFGENSTKQRIKNVLSFKKPAVWLVIVLAVLAVIVSVVLCANRSKADDGGWDYQPSESVLNDGKYYAYGANSNAYFVVKDGTIQLFGAAGDNWTESERTKWEKPIEYKICNVSANEIGVNETEILLNISYDEKGDIVSASGIPYIDENVIEYRDVSFVRAEGTKAYIKSSDAFGAEAYIVNIGDEYKLDCMITNTTSDELSVNLSQHFGLCYSSEIVHPTAYGPTDEYTFEPNESKNFVFNVKTLLEGNAEDTRIISGSCVLEITNSDKYSSYNVLELGEYSIENDDDAYLSQNDEKTWTKQDITDMFYNMENSDKLKLIDCVVIPDRAFTPIGAVLFEYTVNGAVEVAFFDEDGFAQRCFWSFHTKAADPPDLTYLGNGTISFKLETEEHTISTYTLTINDDGSDGGFIAVDESQESGVTPMPSDNINNGNTNEVLNNFLDNSSGIIIKQLNENEYIYGNKACELLKDNFSSDFCLPIDKDYSESTLYYGAYEFKPDVNAKVFSMNDGTVLFSGYNDKFGNMAVIDHGNNNIFLYANMNSLSVSANDTVNSGTVIGYAGDSGYTSYCRVLIYNICDSDSILA